MRWKSNGLNCPGMKWIENGPDSLDRSLSHRCADSNHISQSQIIQTAVPMGITTESFTPTVNERSEGQLGDIKMHLFPRLESLFRGVKVAVTLNVSQHLFT